LTAEVAQFDTGSGGGATTQAKAEAKTTAPVGTHKPNAFGLYDMHGNVSEWVADNFHDDYSGAPANGELVWKDPEKPYLHVHRGGSYNNTAPTCRSAMREAGGSETEPELRTSTIGFRVVIMGPTVVPAGAAGRHRARHASTASTAPAK
jgi:formylglycine-generating enzyme required for sulfatase activity